MNWTKYTEELPIKPEVYLISKALKRTRFEIAGHLMHLWTSVGKLTVDGVLPGDDGMVDTLAECEGLASAMRAAGWLADAGDGKVRFPGWKTHNDQAAKRRAMDAKRKQRERKALPKAGQSTKRPQDVRIASGQKVDARPRSVRTASGPEKSGSEKSKSADGDGVLPSEGINGEPREKIWFGRELIRRDLEDNATLMDLYARTIARGWLRDSEHALCEFVACAEHALRAPGISNRPALFIDQLNALAGLPGNSRKLRTTLVDEDAMRARIRAVRGELPAGTDETAARPGGRPLSDDALKARAILRAASSRGGDPWHLFGRELAAMGWDKARWERAMTELSSPAMVSA